MSFDTKIAIAVRADLATWQKLNVTAFLTSGTLELAILDQDKAARFQDRLSEFAGNHGRRVAGGAVVPARHRRILRPRRAST